MKDQFPAQYAMTFLGFATGLRPSTLRPLRRTGATPDVLWDEGVVLVRRSHTIGDEYMNTTKTKLRQRITVPPEVMEVLRWHVAAQLTTPEQKASELLFPAEDGGFRSVSFLKKAFATVAHLIGLNKTFMPRGMRRTFNDLMRLAKVEGIEVHLRPPDRPHARALLDGHPRRAATEHQQRRDPLRSPTKWGGKWGGHPGEWGG
jgi:integrase